jgi:2TM domain
MATFRSEDVQQILHRAMTHQQAGEFSEQQLKEMATELGISASALQIAQQEWQQEQEKIQQKQVVDARRKRGFKAHLIPFVAVNTFLIILNLITSPKYFWAVYPLLGWGLGLGIHASCTYHLKDEKYEAASIGRLKY